MSTTLVASILLGLVATTIFALVGRAVLRRPVSPELATPRNAFVLWWWCLAGSTLIAALQNAIGLSYLTNPPAGTTVMVDPDAESIGETWFIGADVTAVALSLALVSAALVCIGLAGLLYYLVFLFTNTARSLYVLAVGYVVYYGFLVYFVLSSTPTGLQVEAWRATTHYETPVTTGPLFYGVLLLLILPPFLGALAYLTLYFRLDDPVQKRRLLLVSVSIILWFGTALVGGITVLSQSPSWQLFSRFLGIAAAGTIYYAYAGLRPRGGEPSLRGKDKPKPAADQPERRREASHAC